MPMSRNAWRSFFSKPWETTSKGVLRSFGEDFPNEWATIVDAAREYYPECVIEVRFLSKAHYWGTRWSLKVLRINEP